MGIEQCGAFWRGPSRECGAGVYLLWSHSPEEEEGSFIIEKGIWESDIRRWSNYRSWIPSDQRHLFVPISDFLNTTVIFRMYFSRIIRITPPEDFVGDIEEISEVGAGGLHTLVDTLDVDWRSVYSNRVSIFTIAPPVLLRVYEEPRICAVCFRWTPIEKAEEYEYEVSDDPTFSNSERVHSRRQPARAEDYEDIESYDLAVEMFGPLETLGSVNIDSDLPGARVIYVRVRSRKGINITYSNWSNVLLYRIPEE